jgi:alanine racemase
MPSQPIAIYLKMNSGMNRLGYPAARFRAAWERARACPAIGEIVLMTHFANADNGLGIADQMGAFVQHAAGIAGARCLSNSAAVLWHPHIQSDWVRPGIMLYGASPSGAVQVLTEMGLQAGMTLSTEIIGVQNLTTDATIGYGSLFTATAPLRIGVVACGYADGYPRHAPNGTPILVDGIRTRIVGRVSMDMVTVDLTPCPNAGVGAPVECWGARLPIDEVANASGTIGYELMCAVAQRVPIRAD